MQNKLIADIKLKFPTLTEYLDFLKSEGTLLEYGYPAMFFDGLNLYEFVRIDEFKSYVEYIRADKMYDIEVFSQWAQSDIGILLNSYGIDDTTPLVEYLEEKIRGILIEQYENVELDSL